MSVGKTLMGGGVALAIAIAFSPVADLQATPLMSSGSQPVAENLVQIAKKKHHRAYGYRGGKGPGQCGAFMYYSRKDGRCMDAREKSS